MSHHLYMQRCLDLAKLGAGHDAPNPMVGAVLVHEDKIIGEGWHQQYGEAHAELNCIESVRIIDLPLIRQSVLYVSLEPCAHHGKTPPCTDLIIKFQIPKVVIGCRDPFKEVDGKGIEKLKAAGVEVAFFSGELEKKAKDLNKRFFTFHTQQRPYVILKWAQTGDGKMAAHLNPPRGRTLDSDSVKKSLSFEDSKTPPAEGLGEAFSSGGFRWAPRLLISNDYSNRLVHKWRSEEASILIGTNTAMMDDPELTTRLWAGSSPTRLVLDMNLRLPSSLKIFNLEVSTIIFNNKIHTDESESATPSPLVERAGVRYYKIDKNKNIIEQLMEALHQLKIQSVLVEGGAKMLQSFIDEGIWDEARIISNKQLTIGNGLPAPVLRHAIKAEEQKFFSDTIEIYKPVQVEMI